MKIKAVKTNRYEVELIEEQDYHKASYFIQYRFADDEDFKRSELIKEFDMANYMYETKLQELEGH